jgi:hypothetical protein
MVFKRDFLVVIMIDHAYNSVTYCAQRLKEFLESYMPSRYGHKFPKIEHHKDYVSFDYTGETFAVRLEILEGDCKKGKAHLEIKAGDSWPEISEQVFNIKRSKTGRISDKTYEPLFKDLIIKGIGKYKK